MTIFAQTTSLFLQSCLAKVKSDFDRLKRYSYDLQWTLAPPQIVVPQTGHMPHYPPYSSTLVCLENGNFIDANRIGQHIITRHPFEESRENFWQMIIENDVDVIVMLNGDSEYKLSAYYPKERQEIMQIGEIAIHLLAMNRHSETSHRTLEIEYLRQKRTITHLKANQWQDLSLPHQESFLKLIKLAKEAMTDKPILIHCRHGSDRANMFSIFLKYCDAAKQGQIEDIPQMIYEEVKARKNPETGRHRGSMNDFAQYAAIIQWLEELRPNPKSSRI